jgi:Predicted membrane protein
MIKHPGSPQTPSAQAGEEVFMSRFGIICLTLGLLAVFVMGRPVPAQQVPKISPEHRKQLNDLSKEVPKAATMIRKKDYDEAEKLLDDLESRLSELATETGLPMENPLIQRVSLLISKQQAALAKATGKEKPEDKGVSFMKDVAPLIIDRCVRCHGEQNPRNGLRLDRFAGWRAGGRNGPLLIPGNPGRSLIMARVNAPEGQGRMPPNGEALSAEEKNILRSWIEGGAKFDGEREDATFAALIEAEEAKNVVIPKPKGGEKVSFTRDIAPWMANLCLNCHNSRRKSGGLSVETFFDIMKGGDSGEVIIPGDMENSRFFRLVGGKELPRMPQGQARITRKNYEDMVTWFKEGNTYDGNDPKTPIRSFVLSENEMTAQKLGSMSDEELQKFRVERSEEQYRKAVSREDHPTLQTEHFYLLGNVDPQRLAQVQGWADEHLRTLQKAFPGTGKPWRGRLAIFVMKDRIAYSEFNEIVENRRIDPDLTGHSKVTSGQEDAYIVLLDTGDNPTEGPSLQASVIDHLTGAYLQRSGVSLPLWVVRGTGLAMADAAVPDRKRTEALERLAAPLLASVTRPEQIFADGTFSPSGTAAVGYTLVKFLLANGGQAKFSKFISAIESGSDTNAALRSAYGASPADVATGYFAKMKSR